MTPHDPDDPVRRRRPRHDPHPAFPIDPDVTGADFRPSRDRALRLLLRRRDILLVIALGGALGAAGRYGMARAIPHTSDRVPLEHPAHQRRGLLRDRRADGGRGRAPLRSSRLVRPFFGTGLLGGFTTFSTYAVDTRALLAAGRPAVAAAYLFGTPGARAAGRRRRPPRDRAGAAMTLLLVLLGGAVGAPTRYLTDVAVQRLHRTSLPVGHLGGQRGRLVRPRRRRRRCLDLGGDAGRHGLLRGADDLLHVRLRDRPPRRGGRDRRRPRPTSSAASPSGSLAAALGWWLGALAGV